MWPAVAHNNWDLLEIPPGACFRLEQDRFFKILRDFYRQLSTKNSSLIRSIENIPGGPEGSGKRRKKTRRAACAGPRAASSALFRPAAALLGAGGLLLAPAFAAGWAVAEPMLVRSQGYPVAFYTLSLGQSVLGCIEADLCNQIVGRKCVGKTIDVGDIPVLSNILQISGRFTDIWKMKSTPTSANI